MARVSKSPADPWPDAERGLEIQLLPGIHRPVEFSGAVDMIIMGGEGVSIEGSVNPGGGEPPCSMRFHDGCHRLRIIGPIELRHSDGRGVRITEAEEIHLSDLYIHHCSIEGIITGNCPNAVYERITVEDSRDSSIPSVRREYTPDKRHGIYVSGDGSGSAIDGLTVRRVTGSGCQCNGAGMNAVINGLHASEMVFERCGSGGTPPISLMGCRDCTFEKFTEDWTAGEKWCVLFDDYKGAAYACSGNTFQDYTVPSGTYPSEEGGSHDNTFRAGQGWSPDEPIPPEPEPEPPDNEALTQALNDAQAAVRAIGGLTSKANAALLIAQDTLTELAQQTAIATEALDRAQAAAGE